MIDRSHGGNIAEFMEKYQIPKDKIIDFSANINPLGLSKKVSEYEFAVKMIILTKVGFVFKEREILWKRLKAIKKLRVYPPASNFILCKLTNKEINVERLFEKLAQQGIIIRNCKNFRGLNNKFFRIAVRKREENNKLISALKTYYES